MSTIEILIAFTILTLTLSAVDLVLVGHQSVAIDIQTNDEALSKARALLEKSRALARTDFNLVNTSSSTEKSDAVAYSKTLSVSSVGLFTKQATSTVSWKSTDGRILSVILSTLFTNPTGPKNGLSCSSVLTGNWSTPLIGAAVEVGSGNGGNPVTGVVAFNKKLYITTSNTSGHNNDFYIYDLSDPRTPMFISSIDANGLTPGLKSLAVSSTTGKIYAYVANVFPPNFTTCSEGPNCSQVQVIDITNPASPTVVRNYKIPGVTGSGGQGVANSVLYKNGYLYVGLTKAGSGGEFHIIDVGAGALASPTHPIYKGSYTVGRGVNGVAIFGTMAYVTTDDTTQELIVLDITDPTVPVRMSIFNPSGSTNFGQGYSIASVGTSVYLGRNYVSNAPEFYILDLSQPVTPKVFSSLDIGISSSPQSVNDIVVRDTLVFLTTSGTFQVWNIVNPATPVLVRSVNISSMGISGTASGCEGNYLYLGAYKTTNDKGVVYAVYPDP